MIESLNESIGKKKTCLKCRDYCPGFIYIEYWIHFYLFVTEVHGISTMLASCSYQKICTECEKQSCVFGVECVFSVENSTNLAKFH